MSDPVLTTIDGLGVDYEVIPCDPQLADTAQFCEAYGYSPEDSANTIVVVGKADPRVYVACVVLASTKLDVNGTVKKKLGIRRTSFASGDETVAVTGMTIGGVTPFGLPKDLPIWIDERVMARETIILGGGSRDRKISAPPAILTALPAAEVVTELAKEFEPR
ncbi:MAG: YbaK/EbsC family protein [Acidimicrobiia bacterium]|jgi:prolyl-tRNA editing enzyme YbaK/EbsC (Cys-tRNA(Pro) deacylase)